MDSRSLADGATENEPASTGTTADGETADSTPAGEAAVQAAARQEFFDSFAQVPEPLRGKIKYAFPRLTYIMPSLEQTVTRRQVEQFSIYDSALYAACLHVG